MPPMLLYGTLTSPYVRRVRIWALELRVSLELVDTATESGQAALRAFNPLWKVPALDAGEVQLFDSADIVECLLRAEPGRRTLPAGLSASGAQKLKRVVDGALDASINAFYLKKDGVLAETSAYVDKQEQRVHAALSWLEEQLPRAYVEGDGPLNTLEVDLVTALDWMDFRKAHPTGNYSRLAACRARHALRESFLETAPEA